MNELEESIYKKRLERMKFINELLKEEKYLDFYTDDVKFKLLFSIMGANKDLDTEIYFLSQKK